jgi:hypothetical protein
MLILQRQLGAKEEGENLHSVVKTSLYLFFETFAGIQMQLSQEFLVCFHLNMQA